MNRFDDEQDPGRRLLLQALALGLIGAQVPLEQAAASLFGDVPKQLPPGRSIFRLEGDVRVNGAPATLDTFIRPNDTIETALRSAIMFVVGKDAFLLRDGSRLTLSAPPRETAVVETLKLYAGKLLSVFGKSRHQLVTATSTVGIRGTGIYTEVDPDETYLCTCYGVVDVNSNQDKSSKTTVQATHHDRPLYIVGKAQPGNAIRPAPMKNHTDQELMLIEELVGRTPPFVFPADDYRGPRRDY